MFFFSLLGKRALLPVGCRVLADLDRLALRILHGECLDVQLYTNVGGISIHLNTHLPEMPELGLCVRDHQLQPHGLRRAGLMRATLAAHEAQVRTVHDPEEPHLLSLHHQLEAQYVPIEIRGRLQIIIVEERKCTLKPKAFQEFDTTRF